MLYVITIPSNNNIRIDLTIQVTHPKIFRILAFGRVECFRYLEASIRGPTKHASRPCKGYLRPNLSVPISPQSVAPERWEKGSTGELEEGFVASEVVASRQL